MVEPTKTGGNLPQAQEATIELRHQPDGVDLSRIARWIAALFLLIALSLALCAAVMYEFNQRYDRTGRQPQPSARTQPMQTPAPGLQYNSPQELQKLRAREHDLLHSAEWIDRPQGIARIPIEDAMQLVIERNQPAPKKDEP
jgi:hypothetical protein